MPCPVCGKSKVRNFHFGSGLITIKNLKECVVSNLVICANCGNVYDAKVGRCVFEKAVKVRRAKERPTKMHI